MAIAARRRELARRSISALAVGFPVGILAAFLATVLIRPAGIAPETLSDEARPLTAFISQPDVFSAMVAYLAGTAGILSLTSAKSGALIGVVISVTTIPAAANVGVAAAYRDAPEAAGAAAQVGINLATIIVAGMATLYLQWLSYLVRRRRRLGSDGASESKGNAGLGPPGATATGDRRDGGSGRRSTDGSEATPRAREGSDDAPGREGD